MNPEPVRLEKSLIAGLSGLLLILALLFWQSDGVKAESSAAKARPVKALQANCPNGALAADGLEPVGTLALVLL